MLVIVDKRLGCFNIVVVWPLFADNELFVFVGTREAAPRDATGAVFLVVSLGLEALLESLARRRGLGERVQDAGEESLAVARHQQAY